MFDTTGGRAASAEKARRRLDLLALSLAGELTDHSAARAAEPGEQADAAPQACESPTASAVPPAAGRGRHAARALPRSIRMVAGAGDRVPVPVRAWATRLSGQHLAVVAIVVAAGLCVAAWWGLTSRPEAQAMPPLTTTASAAVPVASAPTGLPSAALPPTDLQLTDPQPTDPAPGELLAGEPSPGAPSSGTGPEANAVGVVVVDVAGRVSRPGIVTLPAGSRVADALDAAGGPRAHVDLTSLNLARVLVDGEQLLVGVEAAVPPAASPPSGSPLPTPGPMPGASPGAPVSLVDLNTATETDLDALPGVGPVTAQAILAWRTEHGGFTSVDELLEVTGIGEVTLEQLRPLVTV